MPGFPLGANLALAFAAPNPDEQRELVAYYGESLSRNLNRERTWMPRVMILLDSGKALMAYTKLEIGEKHNG